jgi:hypothetical protein
LAPGQVGGEGGEAGFVRNAQECSWHGYSNR